jgi:hypothetical protein
MRAAALAAAVTAAAFLPGRPLGIGVIVVAALVALAVVLAARPTRDCALFGVLALALTVPAFLLDAGWVVALDLAAAWILATAAVSGPWLTSVVAPVVRLTGVPALAPPLPSGVPPVVRGSALGVVVVAPFVALFWQADAAFAQLGRDVPLPAADPLPGRALTFALVLLAVLGLALAARRPFRRPLPRSPRKLAPWEWAVPLALLDALFLTFVVVQLAVLFGGHDRVLETAGLTYAEYAREGFWQLLAAAALTLALVGAAVLVADAPRRSHRLLLRALLGILCALTMVVLVSAVQRLLLYEDAFGLTRLRLFATAFALWLGALFALVVVAGFLGRARRRLAHVAVVGTALALMGFSLASPDRLIAERNIDRWRETGRVDAGYLRGLSADAAPELIELPAELGVLADVEGALADDEPWSSFNLSRHRARDLLDSEP